MKPNPPLLPSTVPGHTRVDTEAAVVQVRRLGLQDYRESYAAMQAYTQSRSESSQDQLWLLEHFPVFTLGQAAKPEHLLAPGDIPVVRTDRGGQVTYHGPGQLVTYLLVDLKRRRLGVRPLVTLIECAIIQLLNEFGIESQARADAPGVYVEEAKIASLGLRIRHGCSYHGLALNVAMDLEPFQRINPCGFKGLRVTQLRALGVEHPIDAVADRLSEILLARLPPFRTKAMNPSEE